MNINEHKDISRYKNIIVRFLRRVNNGNGEELATLRNFVYENVGGKGYFNEEVFLEAGRQLMNEQILLHRQVPASEEEGQTELVDVFYINPDKHEE